MHDSTEKNLNAQPPNNETTQDQPDSPNSKKERVGKQKYHLEEEIYFTEDGTVSIKLEPRDSENQDISGENERSLYEPSLHEEIDLDVKVEDNSDVNVQSSDSDEATSNAGTEDSFSLLEMEKAKDVVNLEAGSKAQQDSDKESRNTDLGHDGVSIDTRRRLRASPYSPSRKSLPDPLRTAARWRRWLTKMGRDHLEAEWHRLRLRRIELEQRGRWQDICAQFLKIVNKVADKLVERKPVATD